MTRQEYLDREATQQAIRKLRLKIVGTPRDPNLLGFTGIAFAYATVEGQVLTDNDGAPIIGCIALLNVN